jgi:hypothetical protein
MYAALQALPEKFFSVVELVDIHELSYREAAERLEVPVGTVMSRLFRARRMLAASLVASDPSAARSVTEPRIAAALVNGLAPAAAAAPATGAAPAAMVAPVADERTLTRRAA